MRSESEIRAHIMHLQDEKDKNSRETTNEEMVAGGYNPSDGLMWMSDKCKRDIDVMIDGAIFTLEWVLGDREERVA